MVDLVPVDHDPFSDDVGKQNLSASAAYRRSQAGDESFAPQFVRTRPTLPESFANSMVETSHMLTTPAPRPPQGVSEDDAGRLVVVDPNSGKFVQWHEVDPQGANAYYDEMEKRADLAPSFALGMIGGGANFAQRGALGSAGAKMVQPEGIRAYHGSPHDFDKFDISKIGTGEGAQAYGHGLYFAENEGVARQYRDVLSDLKDRKIEGTDLTVPSWVAKTVESRNPVAIADMRKTFQGRLDEMREQLADPNTMQPWNIEANIPGIEKILKALDQYEAGAKLAPPGRMYEVNIAAQPEHFLDWDKPLSEQPKRVRDLLPFDEQGRAILPNGERADPAQLRGESLYRAFAEAKSGDVGGATSQLHEAGIPGITYLDQGSRLWDAEAAKTRIAQIDRALKESPSRGTAVDNARIQKLQDERTRLQNPPTSNYVVFDPKIIDIVKKYGIAGLGIFPAGAHMLEQVDHNPFAQGRAAGGRAEVKFKDGSEIGLAQNAPGVHFQCRTCKFDDNGTCRNPNPKLDGRKIKPHWCCNLYDHEGMKVIV